MTISVIRHGQLTQKKFSVPVYNSVLLRCMDNFLLSQKIKLKSLKGIVAVTGGEGFTAARLVVTLVNTLSYILNIPARGIPLEKADDCDFITAEFARSPCGRYIGARYSSEARVFQGERGRR